MSDDLFPEKRKKTTTRIERKHITVSCQSRDSYVNQNEPEARVLIWKTFVL